MCLRVCVSVCLMAIPAGGTALVLCSSLVCLSESDHYSQLKPEKKKRTRQYSKGGNTRKTGALPHTVRHLVKMYHLFSKMSGESLLSFPISAFRPSSSSFFFCRLRATAVSLSSLRLSPLGERREVRDKHREKRKRENKGRRFFATCSTTIQQQFNK